MANSETGLATYFAVATAKSSLRAKEKEVINLVVSQVNTCEYCLAAHTALGKMIGLTDEQILEIRRGRITSDPKLDALARFVRSAAEHYGHPDPQLVENLFAAGYTPENLIDIILVIGDKIITNYLYSVSEMTIDFPAAPALQPQTA
jgi:AhpD family alkylhydroperoxidase